jgi:hypothetical protein
VLESLHDGGVAQLGERRVRNAKVGSSILLLSTKNISNTVQECPITPQPVRLAGFFISDIVRGIPLTSAPNGENSWGNISSGQASIPKMPLTEAAIKSTKAAEKPRKLFDGGGLYLLVARGGSKYWRLKYRLGGKEKSLSLGIYPEVTLAAARNLRDEARALLVAGVNPGEVRKQERATLRDEADRLDAAMRFSLDSDGALSIRIGARRVNLSPSETAELRAFLDATRGVPVKE